jgi:nucleoside-diphosphate-sugar epimerase
MMWNQSLGLTFYHNTHTQTQHSGPSRITRLTDLLLALAAPFLPAEKAYAKSHPYFVNYQGMKNLLAAVKTAGVPKFIRVSGLSGACVDDMV